VEVALLHLVGLDLTRQDLAELVEVGLQVVRVGDVLECALQQLGLAVADDLAQGAVDLEPAAVGSDQRDADRCLVEGFAEARLGLLEVHFQAMLVGDVTGDGGRADDDAVRVAQGSGGEVDEDARAVAPAPRQGALGHVLAGGQACHQGL
jgi:hypothetical protein